ncbi:hypothetical protein DS745_08705 [Anaerobacillus alkaliphilus]|uniref:Putative Flp pilus-assembly TadG-like N-terminal domain-containing protein n=1 Tax=Anaerobacillus alkaliphilus TaxID=1548597 RepID=A0A4Q0VUK0_9BACI|nr:TadE/TadG family type IV pilus assembly protein [Anaerobacillus alkaliphilus]RXJ01905.1 hypothetical protein DS745_08705 [Anaerobacillus alkaliphilus]
MRSWLKITCRKLYRDQQGGVLVLVALMMVVLLGVTALVVDLGRVYAEQSSLQKALDASVLAGAQGLIKKETQTQTQAEAQAISYAKDISKKNSYILNDSDIKVTSSYIKVSKEVSVPMTFAKVIGFNEITFSKEATALIGPLGSSIGVTPIAVEKKNIPDGKELKCSNTGNQRGNCGYLDIVGSGATTLADGIRNGVKIYVKDEVKFEFDTETGQKWGPVKSAFEHLIDLDKNKLHCQSKSTADKNCKRVITVAVVDTFDYVHGKDTIEVVGFAAYWLSSINNGQKSVRGEFINMIGLGEISENGQNYGTYVVKLTD